MPSRYDLAIIGAGWAGFNAALKAKEAGLKVCLLEKSYLGGTCLNQGCIPTKTLIQSAKINSLLKKSPIFGIEAGSHSINFIKVQERKERLIEQLRRNMHFMLKGVDFLNTEAEIVSEEEIKTASSVIRAKSILIACGSRPIELPAFRFDGKKIVSSDDILNLKEIPASLLIIGGGVIGCEFASLFANLGTEVAIVEKMPQLLPQEDREISRKIEAVFKKKGIKVNTGADARGLDLSNYSLALVCVGRTPNTGNLGLEKLGVGLEGGRIIVDDYLRTNIPNIYAAGDCTGKVMLAHFAAYQGNIAAGNIINPDNPRAAGASCVPNCIFTDPEVATVGLSEEEAKKRGIDIVAHKFDFLGSGMARILEETEGFIKIISERATEEILGSAIIGPRATELIAILTLAAANRLKISQVKNTLFAHPTLSEAISETLN